MVAPLISGVFGANLRDLSAPSALPELYRMEQKSGSLWWGMRRFSKMKSGLPVLLTMEEGMSKLIERLSEALTTCRFHFDVSGLRLLHRNGEYRLQADQFDEAFQQVVFAAPALNVAQVLNETAPEAESPLLKIPYASSTLVYLGYKKSEFSHPLNGFGFVVPPSETQLIDACTWVTTKFDGRCPPDRILLRCALHGGMRPGDDARIVEQVHGEVSKLMELSCLPVFSRVFHVQKSLPRMLVGHGLKLAAVKEAISSLPHVHIASSFAGGVGIPDCIKRGKETAAHIVTSLTGRREARGKLGAES
jgi:oxygen-dependent protoporphyrinogen oxidase